MLIVISPAKTLDYTTPPATSTHTRPEYVEQSQRLINILRNYSALDLAELMHLSIKLAELNFERYHAWRPEFTTGNAKQAVLAMKGDVYSGLDGAGYDLIVSNPPYVDAPEMAALPAEYRAEPPGGLAAGDDGLDVVRRILAGAAARLSPEGVIIVEVGNSAPVLATAYPEVPFLWLDFERVGDRLVGLDKVAPVDEHHPAVQVGGRQNSLRR